MKLRVCFGNVQGFSLIEMMIALSMIAIGLIAASQLLYITAASNSLARSKSTAAIAAQDTMEALGALYRRNPSAADLAPGDHGPRTFEVINPSNGAVLNRYAIGWAVQNLPDPRPGRTLKARIIRATVTPVTEGGATNNRTGFNKILNLSTVLSQEMQ